MTTNLQSTMRQRILAALALLALVLAALNSTAPARASSNSNPGVVPNNGPTYGNLGAQWWQWALSFEAADLPFFNTGGAVDISAHQSGNVWFLAGANNGLTEPRTGTVPAGKKLFFPLGNLINDYPCPAEFGFEPGPATGGPVGESLEAFLQRTGNGFLDYYFNPSTTTFFTTIDDVPLGGLASYRATSKLFTFTADADLAGFFDPCITGSPQPGVALGYWLLLTPLTPGEHTIHFGAISDVSTQDITYNLTVQ